MNLQRETLGQNEAEPLHHSWLELQNLLRELQRAIGTDIPLASDPMRSPDKRVDPNELVRANQEIERGPWLREKYFEFEELVVSPFEYVVKVIHACHTGEVFVAGKLCFHE